MSSPWLHVLRPKPQARVRLFTFPYAGAGASSFRIWNELLPAEIELNAIQLPGREGRLREPPLTDITAVLEGVLGAIGGQLDRPYLLYGHSLGATLAFELARTLAVSGGPAPAHLFVAGRIGPDCAPSHEPIHALPQAQFIETLGRRYQVIPAAVLAEPELLDLLLPALRADLQIVEQYRDSEQPALDVPITAFGGRQDPLVPEPALLAWARQTRADFEAHMFEGGHFFVNDSAARVSLVKSIVARATAILASLSAR